MKNRKRKSAAALAAGMSVLLGAGTIAGATEQTDNNKISREETVYVNTEADGTVKEVTVSEWLKNVKAASGSTLADVSELSEIKNTKGDEEFTQDGKNITWETDGRDIHYEGKTDPV